MEADSPSIGRSRRRRGEIDARPASGAGTIERFAIWLLALGLAWVPFRYGSNDLLAWGINAVLFPGLAAFYEISILIRRVDHLVGIRDLALPAALFGAVVFWIWFQTLALGHSALVDAIWDMTGAALGLPFDGSITVNRDLTNLALVRLVTAASVFWLALQLCGDGARATFLLKAIAVIGCLYAAYGLTVFALESGRLPWLEIPSTGGSLSSTFINHNSFATYAGLGLIAIVGLILRVYRRELAGREVGWRLQLASFIEAIGSKAAAPVAGAFVILVALLLTGSRGGVSATFLGLLTLSMLTHQRDQNRVRTSLGILIVGILLTATALFAFGDAFVGSIAERGIFDEDRISVYRLTMRSVVDSPLLGRGYGTFVDVFPLYRDRSISVQGTWGQAHDTYLEIFQGLGLAFGVMLVACVLLLVVRCLKAAIRRQAHVTVPSVAVGAAVLVGTHALVDFSLQIQAVTLTFMALVGAGVAQSSNAHVVQADRRTGSMISDRSRMTRGGVDDRGHSFTAES